ncbi:hypothetical protein B2J93_1493 [Marssonina coronariae]|uniref:Uncharacterized protein n=1 Tax=Diplocarpon coronariae TaxID=2795749 RepID=A0A218Z1S2_9HELO|nr:hypothetical protein B2J93_1493 [Marssonina coronariae]
MADARWHDSMAELRSVPARTALRCSGCSPMLPMLPMLRMLPMPPSDETPTGPRIIICPAGRCREMGWASWGRRHTRGAERMFACYRAKFASVPEENAAEVGEESWMGGLLGIRGWAVTVASTSSTTAHSWRRMGHFRAGICPGSCIPLPAQTEADLSHEGAATGPISPRTAVIELEECGVAGRGVEVTVPDASASSAQSVRRPIHARSASPGRRTDPTRSRGRSHD